MPTGDDVQLEKSNEDTAVRSYIKGARERVFAKCRHYLVDSRAQYDDFYNIRFFSSFIHMKHVGHKLISGIVHGLPFQPRISRGWKSGQSGRCARVRKVGSTRAQPGRTRSVGSRWVGGHYAALEPMHNGKPEMYIYTI
jgi:hypothetical protein